ncbi:MAG: hypothetical protein AB8H03_24035 [Saprospiraceae bacterium]
MNILQKIKSKFNSAKYLYSGQRINRRIVVIESDDWGTIRSTSKAIKQLQNQNIELDDNPFNRIDILENAEDFSALYEVLGKYKDKNNRPPIITANTIVGNPDFQKIQADDFQKYHFEIFTETYKNYWSTNNTMEQFSDGIKNQFLQPQFHGREHVNVAQWLRGLHAGEKNLRRAFEQQIFGIDFHSPFSNRANFMATYDFDDEKDLINIHQGIKDGLEIFRMIFGMHSLSTVAPAVVWHPKTESVLAKEKVKFIQGYIVQNIPTVEKNSYQKLHHFSGERNQLLQKYIVRNCYFEPSFNKNFDWGNKCLAQIKKAFLFRQPAVISAHRINFVGGIEEQNRTDNLKVFEQLLKTIISKWPDVEFLSSDELGNILEITENHNN